MHIANRLKPFILLLLFYIFMCLRGMSSKNRTFYDNMGSKILKSDIATESRMGCKKTLTRKKKGNIFVVYVYCIN